MIYLDTASTAKRSKIDDLIIEEMVVAMKEDWQNPSSLNWKSKLIKNKIEEARKVIADYINAEPEEIYFTSGGSEANNWAIQGFLNKHKDSKAVVVTSEIEHHSILKCVEAFPYKYDLIDVDEYGFINEETLKEQLYKYQGFNTLVSFQWANNELGTVQKLRNLVDLVHEYDGIIHSDAVQAFGKIPINVKEVDVDLISVSGHKISPVLRGIGFLYISNRVKDKFNPLIYGSQENSMRGSTENTYGIIGLAKAIKLLESKDEDMFSLSSISYYFMNELMTKFNCTINGSIFSKLPHIISVTFPQDITGESLLYTLDTADIFVATGSACDSHSIESSHVLKAIGLTNEQAMKTVRFSLDSSLTIEDIDKTIEEIDKAIKLIEV